jgi:hypothetical protein
MFSIPGGQWGHRRRLLFLPCQISLLALGGFLEVRIADDVVWSLRAEKRRLSARHQRQFSQILGQERSIGTRHHGLGLDSLQYFRIAVVVGQQETSRQLVILTRIVRDRMNVVMAWCRRTVTQRRKSIRPLRQVRLEHLILSQRTTCDSMSFARLTHSDSSHAGDFLLKTMAKRIIPSLCPISANSDKLSVRLRLNPLLGFRRLSHIRKKYCSWL